MMNRNWWEQIQSRTPLALEDCIDQLKVRYPDRWREEIRDHKRLLDFFTEQSIVIHLLWYKDNRGQKHYAFRIKSQLLSITSRYRWTDVQEAHTEAFGWAFSIHEKAMEYKKHRRATPLIFPKKENRRT